MMKKLLIAYGIGFVLMMPFSMLVLYKILCAETEYEDMVVSDNGEFYEPDTKTNVLSTIFFVSASSFLWPFTTVAFVGICFFNWIAKKSPNIMGYMFEDPDEIEYGDIIDKNEDEYL